MLSFFAAASDFTRRLTSVRANSKFCSPSAGPDAIMPSRMQDVVAHLRSKWVGSWVWRQCAASGLGRGCGSNTGGLSTCAANKWVGMGVAMQDVVAHLRGKWAGSRVWRQWASVGRDSAAGPQPAILSSGCAVAVLARALPGWM